MQSLKANDLFFMVNVKSYIYGEKLIEFAEYTDNIAEEKNLKVYFTAPYTDLKELSARTNNLIVTSQHLDSLDVGKGMGMALPEALFESGVKAAVLNHFEHSLSLNELEKSIIKAKENGIETIVCASTINQSKAVSQFNPDVILCEPNELIGTGKMSDNSYVRESIEVIKQINPNIKVMHGAGVKSELDVERLFLLGVEGVGCTSGILNAPKPKLLLKKMLEVLQIMRESK